MPRFRYEPTESAYSPAYTPGQEVEASGDDAKALRAHPCFTEIRTGKAKAAESGEPTRTKEKESDSE
jgi:hypothetical protein